LGWGAGLHSNSQTERSPSKQEGDGRSPAGVFAIGAAFGYDAEKPAWLRLPYVPLTSATECVDDGGSIYYNSVVDRVPTQTDGWKSSEKMRQIAQYRWGVIVNQNVDRTPGAGSCIFLHIWDGPAEPTAGCTAMQESDLEEIMRWLDPTAHPLLVALPAPEYERLRRRWRLPPQ
jgi:zinc D-Ala-D-Ala dipeptidase